MLKITGVCKLAPFLPLWLVGLARERFLPKEGVVNENIFWLGETENVETPS